MVWYMYDSVLEFPSAIDIHVEMSTAHTWTGLKMSRTSTLNVHVQ